MSRAGGSGISAGMCPPGSLTVYAAGVSVEERVQGNRSRVRKGLQRGAMKKFVIGWVKFKPERRAAFLNAMRAHAVATRQEEGCVFFYVSLSMEQPDIAVIVECFKSAEAHELHHNTPRTRAFMAKMADILVEGRFENILSDNVISDGL
jgi:quinol monooxygenase YgiN